MHENHRKNILSPEIEYISLSLLANKIRVLIVGGGKAGLIKAKTFIKKGCAVTVVSEEFLEDFLKLQSENKLILYKEKYVKRHIMSYHLIIIATEKKEINERIQEDCEKENKLFLNCSNFKEGLFVMPCHGESKTVSFALHTKGGSPKTSLFMAEKVKKELVKHDSFVEFICNLRENIKNMKQKNEILSFTNTEDFYFFYEKGVHISILAMFYGGIDFEATNCNKEE